MPKDSCYKKDFITDTKDQRRDDSIRAKSEES